MRLSNIQLSVLLVSLLTLSFCKQQVNQMAAPPPEIQIMQVIQKDVPLQRDFVGTGIRIEGYTH